MSSQHPSRLDLPSDDIFRSLVDAVEDYSICMLDRMGHVATWNSGAQRIYGYTADEIIGQHCGAFYGTEDVRAMRCDEDLKRTDRAGKFTDEGWRARKNGSRFWASVVITAIRGAANEVLGYAHVTRDLSERKLAAARAHVEEERFRLLVGSVRDYAIFMLDPQGNVATWNAGAERIKGYRADEIIGRHFSSFYPVEDARAGKCERLLNLALTEGRVEDEGWRVRKDGTKFWADVVITALRDADGTLVGFGKVTRDLTERRLAEQHRLAAEERFRKLIDSVRDYAIFILDPLGNIATWNTGAQRIKGYRAEEIIGSHFSRFYPEEDVRKGKCEMELEVAARDGRFEDEDWRIRKDGSRFWANVVISAIRDEDGRLVGFSKVTRDLTERKRAEEERAARLAAEEANRTKDQFLAMLGHELRNPLAPIVSALQLVKLRGDNRTTREFEIIERQTRQMMKLVDDLLDVSRIAQGKFELARTAVDIRRILAKAVDAAAPMFEAKGQHFEVKAPQRPLTVHGDETRLVQVFTNLLNNASKYTDRGGHVVLVVRREQERLAVEVRDDGAGINAELLPRIFELFVQGHQDLARVEGGLGLGLTLVRHLVELHGGEVEARSAGPGRGSRFIVRLPYDHVGAVSDADEELSVVHETSPEKKRILIVDDNVDARDLLAELLKSMGQDVMTAGDAMEALDLLDDYRPQVAILDIGLPGMSGHELAERIRQTTVGRDMKLIAVTGYGQASDHAQSVRSGFDLHLVKPVDAKKLIDVIRGASKIDKDE